MKTKIKYFIAAALLLSCGQNVFGNSLSEHQHKVVTIFREFIHINDQNRSKKFRCYVDEIESSLANHPHFHVKYKEPCAELKRLAHQGCDNPYQFLIKLKKFVNIFSQAEKEAITNVINGKSQEEIIKIFRERLCCK